MKGKTAKLLTKASIVFILLGVLMGAVSASPGIELTLTPRNVTVQPGETVAYTVEVKSITTEIEHVTLSIEEVVSGWGYNFSEHEFDIAPGETKFSNLDVSVPSTTSLGAYESTIKAEALVPGWPPFLAEKSYFTIITTTVPEFTTVLIPVTTILGMFLLLRFKKRRN